MGFALKFTGGVMTASALQPPLRCRARVGLDRCPNEAVAGGEICRFHAGLQGPWASASLRRSWDQEVSSTVRALARAGRRVLQGKP